MDQTLSIFKNILNFEEIYIFLLDEKVFKKESKNILTFNLTRFLKTQSRLQSKTLGN